MNFPSRTRYIFSDPCPIHVNWICADNLCGYRKNMVDGRRSQVCPGCKGTEGTTESVRHYKRDTHDLCVKRFRDDGQVRPVDSERMKDLTALVDWLTDPMNRYRMANRQYLRTTIETRANIEARNTSNAALLRIESVVRTWVRDHPEGS